MFYPFWIFLFHSVPLNIIINVDNYTLRNGTEQSLVMTEQTPTIGMILLSYSARVVRTYILPSLRPSLRLSVLTRFYYIQFPIFVTRCSAYSCSLPFIPIMQCNLQILIFCVPLSRLILLSSVAWDGCGLFFVLDIS